MTDRKRRPYRIAWFGLLMALATSPAFAEIKERPLCPARPGLATPPCVVDAGKAVGELGVLDWTLDRQPGTRKDTLVAGDLLLRFGIDPSSEVQLGLTGFGTVRTRANGAAERLSSVGDVTLAFKHSLKSPDGSGFSAALQAFVTLPTGGDAIGAGDWGAGLLVPLSMPLTSALTLELTPEIDAAVNASGTGRHVALVAVEGLSLAVTVHVSVAIELEETHDADPVEAHDHGVAGLALAWQPSAHWQLDLGSVAGLDRASPDIEVYFGISRRF